MRKVALMLLVLGFTLACNDQEGGNAGGNVDVKKAMKIVDGKDMIILDVRTPEEYKGGHLPGAENINYYDETFVQQLEDLPRDKEYLVYCHSGGRSIKTLNLMSETGFKKVYNLEGGISAWKFADGKVEK